MSIEGTAVSQKYKDLYSDYYADGAGDQKRSLAADMCFQHIADLVGGALFVTVADVGAGQGSLVEKMSRAGFGSSITALEISTSGLHRIASRSLPNVSIRPFDGYHANLPDKAFDLAVSMHVLEHVEHERMFLSELKRIARSVVIEVPLELTDNPEPRIALQRPYGHINFYTPGSFKNLLETCGFKISALKIYPYSDQYAAYVDGRFGVLKNSARSLLLRLWPTFATRKAVYSCTAYCEC